MALRTTLTAQCIEGQEYRIAGGLTPDLDCPYLFSSDSWLAWMAGCEIAGMSTPLSCSKSRGFSVKILTVGGNVVRVQAEGNALESFTVFRE